MKNIVDFINEGNISNVERKYREFCQMCQGYGCNPEMVEVAKTSKRNWAVYCDGKRKFTASFNILDDKVVEEYKIKMKED